MSQPTLSPDERDALRAVVRQVLRDALPDGLAGPGPQSPADDTDPLVGRSLHDTSVAAGGAGAAESVVLRSDADLQAFARRVAAAPQAERDAIVAGTLGFRLRVVGSTDALSSEVAAATVRVEKGAVTERHVREAASVGAVLVLGRKAVLTPLARDRARAAGVEITKEK